MAFFEVCYRLLLLVPAVVKHRTSTHSGVVLHTPVSLNMRLETYGVFSLSYPGILIDHPAHTQAASYA